MTAKKVKIDDHIFIGKGEPCFIVAEMSANHNQDFDRAVKLVEVAKDIGADAIKLQTFTPDGHTIESDKEFFRIRGGTKWDGRTLYDLYSEAFMPWDWQVKLKRIADRLGIILFSTAVESEGVDFLESLNTPLHKISSFEIVDLPLIEKMAKTGKPLIISTGMSTLSEIEEAIQTARSAGADEIVLLKCTSAYPAPPEEVNLRTIPNMEQTFQVPIGLSDHTTGIAVPVTSVALGACMIEKHFTLSRTVGGPDSSFSLEPHELKAMIEAVRIAEKALGKVHYGISQEETKTRLFRRSLFVVRDIKAGEALSEKNIRLIRPGNGMHVRYLKEVLGRRAICDIERGAPLTWDVIGGRK